MFKDEKIQHCQVSVLPRLIHRNITIHILASPFFFFLVEIDKLIVRFYGNAKVLGQSSNFEKVHS